MQISPIGFGLIAIIASFFVTALYLQLQNKLTEETIRIAVGIAVFVGIIVALFVPT